jgi:hypothetical protein
VLTGFRITPVVALIEPQFTPSPDRTEVQEAFMLPVTALLDAQSRAWTRIIGGEEFDMRDLAFGSHLIWGATAGMLLFALYELGLE